MDLIIGKPANEGAAPYYAFVPGLRMSGYSPSSSFEKVVISCMDEIPKKQSVRVVEIGAVSEGRGLEQALRVKGHIVERGVSYDSIPHYLSGNQISLEDLWGIEMIHNFAQNGPFNLTQNQIQSLQEAVIVKCKVGIELIVGTPKLIK